MTTTQHALAFSSSSPAFNFDTHDVRITTDCDGQLWFIAQDVMDALGYAKSSTPHKIIAHVPVEWKGGNRIPTPGGEQQMLCLSESGLYFFLGRSDKPKALPFQKWLASEVLPSIRRTGSYGTPKIDPRALLLEGQMTPTLQLPEFVQKAIDQRAWELVGQAHELIREHLRRRAASHGECGHPTRRIDEGRALAAIARGDLGDALTHAWQQKMGWLIDAAEIHAIESAKFLQKVKQGRLAT